MKLATFTHGGSTRVGVVTGDEIVDLASAAPSLPRERAALLGSGPAAIAAAQRAATSASARLPLGEVRLEAPILRPPEFLAIGLNYADHVSISPRRSRSSPATGTPSGVGGAMKPPRFLAAGDLVRVEIERIGTLENRVIAEPADTVVY